MKKIIELLAKKHKKISTMESCTGGGVANAITNIEGASSVLEFSAITYSNEYKIKMGVNKDIIEKYSVYSLETAKEMSKCISNYANSNYGIGITGKMNKEDINNPYGENNKIFISIYDRDNNKYYNKEIIASQKTRKENKELVINEIIYILNNILK